MRFSQKRTCKNCTMADESLCTVRKINSAGDSKISGYVLPKIPTEPCYKPITNREWSSFIREYSEIQRKEVEFIRLNHPNPNQ